MTTEITTYQNKPIETWTDTEIISAKRLMNCREATDVQWEKLVILSRTYGLNPLLNEIWIIPGKGVTVGLLGMIKAAIRSGEYDGIKSIVCNKDGSRWVGDDGSLPAYATCTVWKKGCSHAFEQTVTWRDFGQQTTKGGSSWDKMPGYMLEKVAKSHALKLAFNLEGLYIPEEFGVADQYDDNYDQVEADAEPVETPKVQTPSVSAKEDGMTATVSVKVPRPIDRTMSHCAYDLARPYITEQQMDNMVEDVKNNFPGQMVEDFEREACRRSDGNYDREAADTLKKSKFRAWKEARNGGNQ